MKYDYTNGILIVRLDSEDGDMNGNSTHSLVCGFNPSSHSLLKPGRSGEVMVQTSIGKHSHSVLLLAFQERFKFRFRPFAWFRKLDPTA